MRFKFSLNVIIIVVIVFVINLTNIKALADSLSSISQKGYRLFDSTCGAGDSDGDGEADCYGMAVKWSDSTGANICTQYNKPSPAAGGNITCSITDDWTPQIRYAIAKVIQSSQISTQLTQADANYFAAELAINQFLYNKTESKFGANITGRMSATYSELYNNYLNIANNANYESDSAITTTLSKTQLTFSIVGSNYESDIIEVSEGSDFTVTTNVGIIEKDRNRFKVIIPVTSITSQTTVKVAVNRSKTLPQARNYYCGDTYQSLTPVQLETKSFESNVDITGTITPLGKLIINKYDSNNVALSGATILVTGTSTGYNREFDTTGNPIIIENLEYDTYVIEETGAPEGYSKAEIKRVTLSQDNLEETVNLIDDVIKIAILKVDETDSTLPGATLKLTDKDGKILKICGQDNAGDCKWETTESEYVIEKIPAGTYYLKEVSAPDTYDVSKDSVKIVVMGDGSVTVDGKASSNATIKFVNKKTRTEISKVSAVDEKELPGATIQLLNSKNEEMSCVILNDEGKEEILEKCTWVSKEKPTVVIGLSKGKYYIKETIAPEGYVLNENLVGFEVKANGTVNKAVMKNDLEVKVPDTLSARSTLLIAISMFDIALGIGILTYVKNNKTEE